MSYVSPFAPKRKSVFATLFGASEELFPFELQADLNAPNVAEFANGHWKQMLADGSADDFVAQIVKKYMPEDEVDAHLSNGVDDVAAAAPADSINSKKSSQSSQKTPRSKRKPAVVAAAPVQPSADSNNADDDEFDTAHHVIRICGVDNAKLLHDRGITQLSQLRGSPVAVLRDIVGDADDVDLWPQMAALLADGHVWFDVERLRASRHVRARSPPARLVPHRSSQDEAAAAASPQALPPAPVVAPVVAPVTPKAPASSSRAKRANPASAKGDSVRSSAKRSHAAATTLATPTRPPSTRVSTRSASKK